MAAAACWAAAIPEGALLPDELPAGVVPVEAPLAAEVPVGALAFAVELDCAGPGPATDTSVEVGSITRCAQRISSKRRGDVAPRSALICSLTVAA